ncbi:hypothetical protein [Paenibacillus sp. N3.4]|uniref:hypothetical protein n=1 Tax=Paenibacillus sp. N3.4 TaxID=2603222 RepID=UPI0011C884BF|nr:hypothetical protein [Paenibacillus sp. N3.4]TXK78397.1 hypothetical protein FU659_20535 [Paenibacillus sp. N3.4]
MRKRLTITILSITLIALMLCGWTAFAATSSGTSTSTSIMGVFKSMHADGTQVTVTTDSGGDQTVPLAKSVWVYRNDQKASLSDLKLGDRIELIVNSKQQAAYVKASSADAGAAANAAVPGATAVSTATIPPTPATPTTPEPTKTPMASTSPSIQESPHSTAVYPDLKDIDLTIEGNHFNLHLGQTLGADGIVYDLRIKPEDAGTIHLKGDQAALWIKNFLGSVDLQSANAEQQLRRKIAEHYDIDASKLNVQMKTHWEQTAKQQKQEDSNEDEDNNRDKKSQKQEAKKKNDKSHSKKHDD